MTIKKMQTLTEYLKGVFWTKEDGKALESKMESLFNKMQTSLDNFAKRSENNRQEIVILNKRVKSAENWIDKASPKLGLKLEH